MQPAKNQLQEAMFLYAEQEIQYQINNPFGSRYDEEAVGLKKQFYQDLLRQYNRRLNRSEKSTRSFLLHEVRRLTVLAHPSLGNRLKYGKIRRWLQNLLLGRLIDVRSNGAMLHTFQNQIGIKENFKVLSQGLYQAGFTQDITQILEKSIAQGLPRFHIRYADIRNPQTDYILHFNLIPQTGCYQFERFDAAKRITNMTERAAGKQHWQNFSLVAKPRFSASEAAHLLNGRGISKNGTDWIILNKTNANTPFQNVFFDLEAALKELPLASKMRDIEHKNLIKTLLSGAAKDVKLNINGQPTLHKIVAVPNEKGIRILDQNNRLVDLSALEAQSQKQYEKSAQLLQKSKENAVVVDLNRKARIKS